MTLIKVSKTRSRHWLATLLLQVVCLVSAAPSWCASVTPVPATTPSFPEICKRVDQHYNRLHSLSVQFTETYQGMGMKRSESGTLLLEKPGRMRWDYAKPAGKVFVIDEKYGYSYTPGDAQAERYPAKQLQDFRSPLRFLLGHTRIEKELTDLTLTPEGEEYRLRGVPKGMGQRVAEVTLTVTAEGRIDAIQWKETDGAITEFQLTNELSNPPLAADTFRFQPPQGVTVVKGMAPI
ncbi:MAG: outer membrane lipoprotein carrier protein LolA [Acidobacteriaceae bacterium]